MILPKLKAFFFGSNSDSCPLIVFNACLDQDEIYIFCMNRETIAVKTLSPCNDIFVSVPNLLLES